MSEKFSEKIEDILKGGPGSGQKGHRTSSGKIGIKGKDVRALFGEDATKIMSALDIGKEYAIDSPAVKKQLKTASLSVQEAVASKKESSKVQAMEQINLLNKKMGRVDSSGAATEQRSQKERDAERENQRRGM